MSTNRIQVHAIVHGRVQGVSFRYHTQLTAESLGITGWVRNLPDRTVEVLGEGSTDQIEKFTSFLQKGPLGARVDSVNISQGEASGDYPSFEITFFSR